MENSSNKRKFSPTVWHPAARWAFVLGLCAVAGVIVSYYWRVFYGLDARGVPPLQITGLCVVLAMAAGAAALLLRHCKDFAKRGACCILLCGALFAFANPPLQTPDETDHYLEDNPEVFWIHFTGSDVKNILAYHGISLDEHVFYCGVLPDYKALFRKIIQELQLCRYGYEDYIASLFNDILLLVDRQQHEQKKATGNVQEQIERAAAYFNENYNTKISIDDYAESLHISTNWFIHNFKQYAGMSPAQYILSLRMVNAQSLLERTTYTIKEISEIVGYENPLYFSRVFKKEIGKSPAQYRKEMIPTEAV